MSPKDATPLDSLPVGRLGIIPLKSCEKLGSRVDDYIVKWRRDREHQEKNNLEFDGYERDSYLVKAQTPRFGTGEAKGILGESVRGDDIYVMVDVCNHSLTYSLCGHTNHMSPDDHFQDLKRVIAAIGGKARRINVIMPFLYLEDNISNKLFRKLGIIAAVSTSSCLSSMKADSIAAAAENPWTAPLHCRN